MVLRCFELKIRCIVSSSQSHCTFVVNSQAFVEAPANANVHAAYLAELGRHDPVAVLKHADEHPAASNEAVVAEYIRALVKSGRWAQKPKAFSHLMGSSALESWC